MKIKAINPGEWGDSLAIITQRWEDITTEILGIADDAVALGAITHAKVGDIVVIDEAHSLGAIPKPNKRAKDVKVLIKKNKSKVILMSGTPTPESYGQMYHQVYGIPNNPFKEYVSFYKFAKDYVDVRQRNFGPVQFHARHLCLPQIKPDPVRQEAPFNTPVANSNYIYPEDGCSKRDPADLRR